MPLLIKKLHQLNNQQNIATMRIIISALFTTMIMNTNAQKTVVPGKKSFEKKWITSEQSTMIWYGLKDTAKFEMGKVIVNIQPKGKELLVINEVKMKNMKMKWIDSTSADLATLQPIHHSSYNMQRDMELFFGNPVTGYYSDKMKKQTTTINQAVDSPYFDSNLYPALVRWLPLKEGYKSSIAIYDYNPTAKMGLIKAYVKEVKSGSYQSKNAGIRNVWIVTVTDEIGNGENGVSTYFIDKDSRQLWKQEIEAGGRKMMMQLLEKE
jgi:hypothetical protein